MGYDSWKTGYGDNDEEPKCKGCQRLETTLDEIEHNVRRLMKELYSQQEIELCIVDDALCNICDQLDIKCPSVLPPIQKKRSSAHEFADEVAINQ